MIQRPRGTRDFGPQEMEKRRWLEGIMRSVACGFGFREVATPTFEHTELFTLKSGPNIVEEIYAFEDKGGRAISLRPELTAPVIRYFVNDLSNEPRPLKLFYIGPCFRYERPQSGRYREFWQCDVDIVGSKSMKADAEIAVCAYQAMSELGFKKIKVRINNRKMMEEIFGFLNIKNKSAVYRAIDKMERVGLKEVKKELEKAKAERIDEFLKIIKINDIRGIEKRFGKTQGIEETKELIKYLKIYNVKYILDLSLVRGLDYYTGPVFEIYSEFGSLAGGGRYDRLIGLFTGRDLPATGISLGPNRIVDLMKQEKMFPKFEPNTKVFVLNIGSTEKKVIEISEKLREQGFDVETDVMGRSLGKQMDYANKKEIPIVVFVGEKEIKMSKVKIRDMKTGKEVSAKIEDIAKKISKIL